MTKVTRITWLSEQVTGIYCSQDVWKGFSHNPWPLFVLHFCHVTWIFEQIVSNKVDLEKCYSRKTIQIFGLRLVLFHFIQFHTICELTRLQFIPGSAKHKNRFESSLACISIEIFKSEWLQKLPFFPKRPLFGIKMTVVWRK